MNPIDPNDLPDFNDYGNPTPNEKFLISQINELIEEVKQLTTKLGQLDEKQFGPLKNTEWDASDI